MAIDPPCHGVGKDLMTSQGHVVPLPLPLLVKDKEYVVDTVRSIVQDVDLDECSEHKIDPLGNSVLHDMIRVSIFIRPLAIESSFYFDCPSTLIVSPYSGLGEDACFTGLLCI